MHILVLKAGSGHAISEAVTKLQDKAFMPRVELNSDAAPEIWLDVPEGREPVEFAREAKVASGGLTAAWLDADAI